MKAGGRVSFAKPDWALRGMLAHLPVPDHLLAFVQEAAREAFADSDADSDSLTFECPCPPQQVRPPSRLILSRGCKGASHRSRFESDGRLALQIGCIEYNRVHRRLSKHECHLGTCLPRLMAMISCTSCLGSTMHIVHAHVSLKVDHLQQELPLVPPSPSDAYPKSTLETNETYDSESAAQVI